MRESLLEEQRPPPRAGSGELPRAAGPLPEASISSMTSRPLRQTTFFVESVFWEFIVGYRKTSRPSSLYTLAEDICVKSYKPYRRAVSVRAQRRSESVRLERDRWNNRVHTLVEVITLQMHRGSRWLAVTLVNNQFLDGYLRAHLNEQSLRARDGNVGNRRVWIILVKQLLGMENNSGLARAARSFHIRPVDARFRSLPSISEKISFASNNNSSHIESRVRNLASEALQSSLPDSSPVTCNSHQRFWLDSGNVAKLDAKRCFSYESSLIDAKVLVAGADLLCAFMGYVVAFPRKSKASNSEKYARQVLSSVLTFYEDKFWRRPGCNALGKQSQRVRLVAKRLREVAPAPTAEKIPVLQYHLKGARLGQ